MQPLAPHVQPGLEPASVQPQEHDSSADATSTDASKAQLATQLWSYLRIYFAMLGAFGSFVLWFPFSSFHGGACIISSQAKAGLAREAVALCRCWEHIAFEHGSWRPGEARSYLRCGTGMVLGGTCAGLELLLALRILFGWPRAGPRTTAASTIGAQMLQTPSTWFVSSPVHCSRPLRPRDPNAKDEGVGVQGFHGRPRHAAQLVFPS